MCLPCLSIAEAVVLCGPLWSSVVLCGPKGEKGGGGGPKRERERDRDSMRYVRLHHTPICVTPSVIPIGGRVVDSGGVWPKITTGQKQNQAEQPERIIPPAITMLLLYRGFD